MTAAVHSATFGASCEDFDLVAQQAGQRLPAAPHEAVTQQQEPPALHLSIEALSVKLPQGAIVWCKYLTVLLSNEGKGRVIYTCAAKMPCIDDTEIENLGLARASHT